MVLPALVGSVGLAMGAANAIGQYADNRRFWNDYERRTGIRPRYKYRSNYYGWNYMSKALVSGSLGSKLRINRNYIQNNSFYRGNWYNSDFYVSDFNYN